MAESFSSNVHTILTSGPQRLPPFPLSFLGSLFTLAVPFVSLLLFFPPWPSISRCPALAPSIFSVCAVKPPLSFFVIFCALIRLSFLGATVRPPFLVMPAREEWEDLVVVDLGLDLVLIVPCAIATVEKEWNTAFVNDINLSTTRPRMEGVFRGSQALSCFPSCRDI
jgi:hypothetical protein